MPTNIPTKLFYTFAGVGALYASLFAALLHPWTQRQALYVHWLQTWSDVDTPETFGFAQGQVTPFRVKTSDGETLYAWHVLPLELWVEHEDELLKRREHGAGDEHETLAQQPGHGDLQMRLLRDEIARVVLKFHGNAGHVAQGWRTDAMKSIGAADSGRTHIITFDYRGFGKSTGIPTEEGLIQDGLAMIDWLLNIAKVPASRIVLMGHSLGTAVSTAALARHLGIEPAINSTTATSEPRSKSRKSIEFPFAGLLLSSGFSNLPELLKTYALFGFLPLLSPFRLYPRLQTMLTDRLDSTWHTDARLRALTAQAARFRCHVVHGARDFEIGKQHADFLFEAAKQGTEDGKGQGASVDEFARGDTRVKEVEDQQRRTWIKRSILSHGGHNDVLTFHEVAVAVRRLFEQADIKAERWPEDKI